MKTNINIAEILRDMPKGTKLYSPIFGDVKFKVIDEDYNYPIVVNTILSGYTAEKRFTEKGLCYSGYTDAEPMLFPSKEMRDWNKFAWKKGDVLVNQDRDAHTIFEEFTDNTYTAFTGKYYYLKNDKNKFHCTVYDDAATDRFTLETEGAAQAYINAIEEEYCGKLNLKTLKIEKQPKFKDGDIVIYKDDVIILVKEINSSKEVYFHAYMRQGKVYLQEAENIHYGYKANIKRLASNSEKQQLFDALAKERKAWDAEKKQIVDLKPKVEFKPFDKVITKDDDDAVWTANIFSHMDSRGEYVTIGCECGYTYCLPYEGNEHLLGTKDNPK